MARQLRHITIPDTHDRIPRLAESGVEMLRGATTDKLKQGMRSLSRIILLSDEQWTVYYEVEDELLERGEWSDELGEAR